MFPAKNITAIQNINSLLPRVERKRPGASICEHCSYINENEYFFCTNCGYPLQDAKLVKAYNERRDQRINLLFKAETSVLFARIALYIIGSFLSLGILFIFAESRQKYFIVLLALILSGLFFFLAFWSQKTPLPVWLTAFII